MLECCPACRLYGLIAKCRGHQGYSRSRHITSNFCTLGPCASRGSWVLNMGESYLTLAAAATACSPHTQAAAAAEQTPWGAAIQGSPLNQCLGLVPHS